jgi:hypothetical protein
MEHLEYISEEPSIQEADEPKKIPVSIKTTPAEAKDTTGAKKGFPANILNGIKEYQESYRIGVEKFGVWWKIFQLSIWGFVLIFLLTAVIILVVYLPKIEMIHLDLG